MTETSRKKKKTYIEYTRLNSAGHHGVNNNNILNEIQPKNIIVKLKSPPALKYFCPDVETLLGILHCSIFLFLNTLTHTHAHSPLCVIQRK